MSMLAALNDLGHKGVDVKVDSNNNLKVVASKGSLSLENKAYLKANKLDIIALYKARNISSNKQYEYLTYSQQRLWFLDQMTSSSNQYNMPMEIQLNGELNIEAFSLSLDTILRRHDILRTVYCTDDVGEPIQVVQNKQSLDIKYYDLSNLNAGTEDEITRLKEAEASAPFELSTDPMIRVSLLQLSAQSHIALITMHHIASDGWSMGILTTELSTLYAAYTQGRENPLSELAIQYADYAFWQRSDKHRAIVAQQLKYWKSYLNNLPEVHNLPLDRPRPALSSFKGARHKQSLSADIVKGLNELSASNDVTLFMILSAAFSCLLGRYSGETDIALGTPIANREQLEIAPLVGFFVNTLVLRTDLSTEQNFIELLKQTKEQLLTAYDNQQVPFEELVNELKPNRNLSCNPLFQVMIVMRNNSVPDLDMPGLKFEQRDVKSTVSKFDLTLTANESEEGLQLEWEYATELFDGKTINRMSNHFETLLGSILLNPKAKLNDFTIVTNKEESLLINEWNSQIFEYDKEQCIHELFEEQVRSNPEAIAAVFEGCEITFHELNSRANQLAHCLLEEGLVPDTIVGLYVERTLDMLIGILGILKAGGAYLPLDPSYPVARISHILEDSGVELMLVNSDKITCPRINLMRVINLQDSNRFQNYSTANISKKALGLNASNLAYVIYTSGTTGQPKGVLLEHRGLCNLSNCQIREFSLDSSCRVLQFASIAFDAATFEWVMSLCSGATLVLISKVTSQSVEMLDQVVKEQNVTHATLPPVLLPLLSKECWRSVKTLIVAGEACSKSHAERWAKDRKFYNAYGPSEATICASIGRYKSGDKCLHIGKPISSTQLYVLDSALKLVPIGVEGDLYIGGDGLARGYYNQPELTARKFIRNPFLDDQRIYSSGDRVRRLPDGNIEFVGRADDQVKVRGFRVELGEVESKLLALDSVFEANVLLNADIDGLVAYVVAEKRENLSSELRDHLKKTLPDYMLPAHFINLESFPLTPNNKVDKKALRSLDKNIDIGTSYVQPKTNMEIALCSIWQKLLKIETVGLTDNFFEIGGHSLLATRLVSEIKGVWNVDINTKTIFEHQTIQELIPVINESERYQVEKICRVTSWKSNQLSFSQQSLWLIDQLEPNSNQYNIPMALQIEGRLNQQALRQSINIIIQRHEILRTVYEPIDSGEGVQILQDVNELPIQLKDISQYENTKAKDAELERIIDEENAQAFDLSSDTMIRTKLVKLSENLHVLLITMHHIASDGWSVGILIDELTKLYTANVKGQPNPLPELALQYVDYANWQRSLLSRDVMEQQLEYWKSHLRNLPKLHSLPLDRQRPSIASHQGACYKQFIGQPVLSELHSIAKAQGCTLFMLLNAAFASLLSRYSGEEDIVIGTPVANRESIDVASLVGCFVNMIVIRTDLSDNPTFVEVLTQSKERLLDAYKFQQLPFEKLVNELQPERDLSKSPLFQILLVLQNNEETELDLPDLRISSIEQKHVVTKYDLAINARETSEGLHLNWEYASDLFDRETIIAMAAHFETLLDEVLSDLNVRIADIALVSKFKQGELLEQLEPKINEEVNGDCIHEVFEQQVRLTPDSVAVFFDNRSLTFGELNERANQLANYLIKQGVGADCLVGLYVERSFEMVIGMIGILKAGGAYVPLEPSYPRERIDYMIGDAKIETVLTLSKIRNDLELNDGQVICLDDKRIFEKYSKLNSSMTLSEKVVSSNLAYVIYTSGSTGKPKGVLVEHLNVVNLQNAMKKTIFDRLIINNWGWNAAFSFDASIQALTALISGAKITLIPEELRTTQLEFVNYLAENEVDIFDCTPTFASHLLANEEVQECIPKGLTWIIGGENISCDIWNKLSQIASQSEGKIFNVYGPTECTVNSSIAEISSNEKPNIGKAIENAKLIVMDRQMKPVPVGVVGELYIAGKGLSRGYLNQPELTVDKFPLCASASSHNFRLYKSGDLVRKLPSGNIEFICRIDNQVKVRGYRIELGEIEAALSEHAQVRDAIAILNPKSKSIVAFVLAEMNADEVQINCDILTTFLDSKLPGYMIPQSITFVSSMPVTASGKVDRKKLLNESLSIKPTNDYEAPSTSVEKKLWGIWKKLFKNDDIGIDDDLFKVGGDSLSTILLVVQIEKAFGVKVPPAILYQNSTIKKLAVLLEQSTEQKITDCMVPLASSESSISMFMIPGMGGRSHVFNELANSLKDNFSIYGFDALGLDGKAKPHESIQEVVDHYVSNITDKSFEGPLVILGHSLGAPIAFEMAKSLRKRGHQVEQVVILDARGSYCGNSELNDEALSAKILTNLARELEANIAVSEKALSELSTDDQLNLVMSNFRELEQMENTNIDWIEAQVSVMKFQSRMIYQRNNEKIDNVLLIQANETNFDLKAQWKGCESDLLKHVSIQGNHVSMLRSPNVKALADIIKNNIKL